MWVSLTAALCIGFWFFESIFSVDCFLTALAYLPRFWFTPILIPSCPYLDHTLSTCFSPPIAWSGAVSLPATKERRF